MSREAGRIFDLEGNEIAGFVYNGTIDGCMTTIFESSEKAWEVYCATENYCDGTFNNWHTCNEKPIEVYLADTMRYWKGSICQKCKAIVDGRDPHWYSCGDRLCDKYGCEHWPKSGIPDKSLVTEYKVFLQFCIKKGEQAPTIEQYELIKNHIHQAMVEGTLSICK